MTNLLIDNPEVIKWCYKGVTEVTLRHTQDEKKLKVYKEQEGIWGNSIVGTNDGKQWTTKLCQDLVMEALIKLGRKNVRRTIRRKSSLRSKSYEPDLECDDYVYEVKGRSWSTPGTAGEKILGVPLKYGEVPRLYDKPLKIILVGYQEYEARSAFGFGDLLNSNDQTKELREALAYHKSHGIEYIGFTDILKEVGLPEGIWE